MELYQLRQFAAVAKYENMTRAAESLNVAQPAVSRTIRNLESELGAELFERTGKGLRRTEQGDILLRYARTILEAERDARGEIEERQHFPPPAPDRWSVHLCAVVRGAYQRDTRGFFHRVRQSGSAHQQYARGQRSAARFRGIAGRGACGRRPAVR